MNTSEIAREVAGRQFRRAIGKILTVILVVVAAGFVGCKICESKNSANGGATATLNARSTDSTEHRIIDVPELKAREKAATTAPAPVRKAFQITIEATPAKLDPWQRQRVIAIVADSYAKIDLARIGVTWIIEDYVNISIISPRYNKGYDLSKVKEVTRPVIIKKGEEFYYLGDIVVSGTSYETENFLKVFNLNLSENTAGLVIGEARPIRSAK